MGQKCELYLAWRGALVGLAARVVWKDAQGRMGLKFLSLDKDSQRRLQELCAALGAQPVPASRREEGAAPLAASGSTKAQRAAHSKTSPGAASAARPERVSERRYRQLPRYVAELPGQLLTPTTAVTSKVDLVDLSISGCRVEGRALPEKGQTCELQTKWEGRQLVFRGEVVWKGKEQAGIAFSALDEGTAKLVRQICANLRLLPPAPLPSAG